MAYFEDLSKYEYAGDTVTGSAPTLNVGWLEIGHAFSVGNVPPSFLDRLALLVRYGVTQATRGFHLCGFCAVTGRRESGHAEIRAVDSNGVRFAAPTLILHYVSEHQYAPPLPFIEAVLRVANLSWDFARSNDLCVSCATQLRRVRSGRDLVRIVSDGSRESGLQVWFACDTCGTEYSRWWPVSELQ